MELLLLNKATRKDSRGSGGHSLKKSPHPMTSKQQIKIRNKIAGIRKALAADKKQWGGYHHDGQGLRYLPPALFIRLNDYKGGLRYLRWFDRAFPDDSGYPIFLFEWTLILFKTGNKKEAEKKAMQAFSTNTYLFDKFLGKALLHVQKRESANWESSGLADFLSYSKHAPEFADFGRWLEDFVASEKFTAFANELIAIDTKLATEPAGPKRSALVTQRFSLVEKCRGNGS